MFPSLIAEIAIEREGRLTDSSVLPIGNILNAPDNENVSSRDKELVHLNDYYFVPLAFFFSTVILLYFSLSHCFRPYQVFTISFK